MPGVQRTAMGNVIERAFREHERALWGMLYRLTGSGADADELVQETFVRLLERPPPDVRLSLKPWLVKVGMNLGLDALRARRRRSYVGPWLPTPVEIGDADAVPGFECSPARDATAEGRYDLLESVTLAFLVALEALTPRQRAVLLLRDVFDYSVGETAVALAISEANVRTVHHRARRAMAGYDAERTPTGDLKHARTHAAVRHFLSGLAARDTRAIEAVLRTDAREISDGGGEYLAALRPILGARNVAKFFLGVAGDRTQRFTLEPRTINGLPALLVEVDDPPPRIAPRFVLAMDVGADGLVRQVFTVLSPRKLAYLRPTAGDR